MNSDDSKLRLIEAECAHWLTDTKYWLGFAVGKYWNVLGAGKDAFIGCDARDLQFEWMGRVVCLSGIKGSVFRDALSLCPCRISDFLSFRLDAVIEWTDFGRKGDKKQTDLVESLIFGSFPGISRLNTWGMCDYVVSDLCGKMGVDVCINVDGKMCCLHCLEVITAQRENVRSGASVYIFGAQSSGVYKIGYSKTPEKRISALATKLPFRIEMSHRILVDSRKAEGILHGYFAKKRVNGEWFALSLAEIEWLSSLKKYEDGSFFDSSGNKVVL